MFGRSMPKEGKYFDLFNAHADLIAQVFGASVAGVAAACAVVKATGTLGGWVMMAGETARAGARQGYLPRGFGQGDRTTRAMGGVSRAAVEQVHVAQELQHER